MVETLYQAKAMATFTVRNLPDEVLVALRAQARRNGRSVAAEVRSILTSAVRPGNPIGLGSVLTAIGDQNRLTEEELPLFARDQTHSEPPSFS